MAETPARAPAQWQALGARFEDSPPQAVLAWALGAFAPGTIALACSFGAEDVALVDMIAQIRPGTHVFYLDTGLLFPETYATRDRIAARYDIRLRRITPPITLEEQAEQWGEDLWARDPDRCCALRKVEPLGRVLAGYKAWITGIRRDQAPTRAQAPVVGWDGKFGLVKVNPLARWSSQEVWAYIRSRGVPYNPLHDQHYPSIGCAPCTRPVAPGEDGRAGRWSGFGKTECGLHP